MKEVRESSIFKAVVTHFEAGNTVLRFGNISYEIYPGYQGRVSYFEGKAEGNPHSATHHMNFDEACEVVALSIETDIAKHWSKEA